MSRLWYRWSRRVKLVGQRGLFWATRWLYTRAERGLFGTVVRLPAVTKLREIMTGMSAKRVLGVVNALEAVGITAWLAGGWGVDALIGHQTRLHADLDLIVDQRVPELESRVLTALASLGFRRALDEHLPGLPMPHRWVMDDGAGHLVDILLVNPTGPPFGTSGVPGVTKPTEFSGFSRGVIRGQAVGCLSAASQLAVHSGYSQRDEDKHDMRVMRAKFGLEVPRAVA
jgi:lincosamide nucleotidyltransferase A/C/D/E